MFYFRKKHINVCYQFVREIINEGRILLQKIGIAENPVDMLTKALIAINHCLD